MSLLSYRQVPADLGLEPPLSSEGTITAAPVRGRVNARWLIGIILTGLAGAALMVLSVTGALSPLRNAVAPPQYAKTSRDDRTGIGAAIVARRGDKLIRKVNLVAARQDFKAPVQVKVGDAEVTRLAAYIRLSSPLALESLGFADSIPAFNLAKLVSLASEDRALFESDGSLAGDTEVQLATRDIATASGLSTSGITLNDDDAHSQIIDALAERRQPSQAAGQSRLAKVMRAPNEGSTLMAFSAGVGDPFSKLVVKMVPENVSHIPRRDSVLTPLPIEEKLVLSRSEQATTQTLRNAGLKPQQIREVISALTRNGKAATLDGNRILKLTMQPSEPGSPKEVMRVELFADEQLVASTGRRDDGSFWPVEVRDIATAEAARKSPQGEEDEDEGNETNSGRLTLYHSIHETARRHEIPPAIIDEAIRTVFFDVDLQRRVAPGDSLEMLVSNNEGDNARPELLLVSLVSQGVKRRYYRFKLPEDDVVDYFDDQGRSVKQFLLRKPMDGGELRSTFGMRRHPILRYYRLHSGVDWAGPVGTPIRAAGNGVVRMAEWDSGYGRRVEIEHNHGYVTTYNHLSAFGPGIQAGARVRQGQIIGRLGSSGLSTGPHLHYEVLINERFVDPLAIKLPKGRELAGRQLANFRRERDQIETVLKLAPGASALVAQN
ncbi:M23 family metallopeptidase [Rhabdaerophilum sp. SD176]|uniref:M23 family metallopeptidase n=1 Tax=Rhabdaerophilum sp. SD176 TaxID=2983548 RepID=UPI0024DF6FFE|nr:M23 family metallopeptidase [Rhabdaerophilum sp. SD176]